MPAKAPAIALDQFATFGDLLKYLRRRAGLTQIELSIAVGYSNAMISRLELNQRLPDLATLTARFVPALHLDDEPEIALRLLELATAVRREDSPAAGLPPYKGLLHFDEADAELFFGREALVERLAERVLDALDMPGQMRFLAIVGASGSGKSSILRAGLLPALRWRPQTAGWPAFVLTPTAHPLEALAASLLGEARTPTARAALADAFLADAGALHAELARQAERAHVPHLLLLADQFEELFTLCRGETERRAFVDNVLAAASVPGGPALVVLTLRADFYAHCADYPGLRAALAQHQEYIGAMTAAYLRRAIEGPAARGRLELEPGLVDVLLRDLGAQAGRLPEPGALPLLSHALLETWQRRRGHTLTLSGYGAAGGVRGAVAETAEAVFHDQLSPAQRIIARDIFLRLTELGADEAVPDTRRRVNLPELLSHAADAPAVRQVLTLLADARLITTEQDAAEVAHEALIREWPTLREWLREDREGLRLHRRLTEAAQEWDRAGRDEGQLYRGGRLAQAVEWAGAHSAELNALERSFVAASQALAERDAAEREAQRQREVEAAQRLAETERARANAEQHRAEEQAAAAADLRARNRLVAAAGSVALVLAVLAALFGLQSTRNASEAQAANTQAVANAATAQQSSLLADEGRDAALAAEATAQAERDRADAAAQSAEEQRALALDAQATAQANRDRADQAAAESFSRELALQSSVNLAVDPERSTLLALAALDAAPVPEAFSALQAATQASRLVWTANPKAKRLLDVLYTPDGRRLVTGGDDGVVRLWDAASGDLLEQWPGHSDIIWVLALTPDGQRLATGSTDRTVRVWDTATGQTVYTLEFGGEVSSVDFSPDGQRLAVVVDLELAVYIYATASGELLETLTQPDWASAVPAVLRPSGAVYSPDGLRLAIALNPAAAGQPGQVELWDTQTSQRRLILPERLINYRNGLSFSPDGARLATPYSADRHAAVWDVATGERLFILSTNANRIRFSADGQRLLTASAGGKAHVWDAATGRELQALLGHTSLVVGIAESPECAGPPEVPFQWCGRWLATASSDGTLRLWDVSPMGLGVPLVVPGGGLSGGGVTGDFVFGEDGGKLLTSLPLDPRLDTWLYQQWSLPDEFGQMPGGYISRTVTFDPGRMFFNNANWKNRAFAAVYETGRMQIVDMAGVTLADFCCVDPSVDVVRATHDSSVAVVLSQSGVMERWDTLSSTRLSIVQLSEAPLTGDMDLNSDGTRAVIVVSDTLRVLNPATGELVLEGVDLTPGFQGNIFFASDDEVFVMDCAANVEIYAIPSGQQRLSLTAGSGGCTWGGDLSPDGRQLAVATNGGPIRVWDVTTKAILFELPRLNHLLDPSFSPDGRLLYAIAGDALAPATIRAYFTQLEDLVAFARTRVTRSLTSTECQQYLHLPECP
jgi:WD40 repeat protein